MVTQSRLVGREKEFEQLKTLVERLSKGSGAFVVIRGEIGIGKTRLVEELMDYASSKNICVLSGRCLEARKETPYTPFTDALAEYFQARKPQELKDIVRGTRIEVTRIIPILGDLMKELEISPTIIRKAKAVEVRTEREMVFEDLLRLLKRIAEKEPVIICLEDLQLMTHTSISLLQYLVRNTKGLPILICATYRPEEAKPPLSTSIERLGEEKLVTSLHLGRLNKNEVCQMIRVLTKGKEVKTQAIELVHEQTKGNPLLIEGMVRVWIEEHVLTVTEGEVGVEVARLPEAMPGDVREIMATRVKKLAPESLNVLKYASVIGEIFRYDVLAKVAGIDKPILDAALDKLVTDMLISKEFEDEVAGYRFNSLVTREVVGKGLSTEERQRMNHQVGEVVEKLYAKKLDEVAQELVGYFKEAKDYERVVTYAEKAGDNARKVFATYEALKHYKSAVAGLGKLKETRENQEKRVNLLKNLGDMYRVVGELEDATKCYTHMLSVSGKLNDLRGQAKAHISTGEVNSIRNRWSSAIENFNRGLKLSKKIEDLRVQAEAYRESGYVYWRKGEYDKSINYFNRAIKYADQLKDHGMIAYLYLRVGTVHLDKDEPEKAIKYYKRSIATCKQINDLLTLAMCYNNLGEVYRLSKKYKEAIEYYSKQIELAKKLGFLRVLGFGYANSGECYAKTQCYNDAEKNLSQALEIFEKLGEKHMIAGVYSNYGILYRFKKEWEAALKYFEHSIRITESLNVPYALAERYYEWALMYEDKGDKGEAIARLEKAIDIWEKLGSTKRANEAREKLAELSA